MRNLHLYLGIFGGLLIFGAIVSGFYAARHLGRAQAGECPDPQMESARGNRFMKFGALMLFTGLALIFLSSV
jgi:hypothetical protein